MNLNRLTPAKGSTRASKRIGRGNATGQGRTAGKGHKGYKSRSGTKTRFHFEGGQTPLARRIPKRGMGTGKFNHLQSKKNVQVVNLSTINKLNIKKINVDTLIERGLIKKASNPVKILGNGKIDKVIEITADMFSEIAVQKIEKSGGKVIYDS